MIVLNSEKRKKRGYSCLSMVITLVLGGGILLGVGAAVLSVVMPNALNSIVQGITGISFIESRPVDGDPARFDPITSYSTMQAFAGENTQLISLEAQFVRSDGTLDLTASYTPSPRVTAEFAIEVPAPADAPPVGAGGLGTWYQDVTITAYRPGQTRHVRTMSGSVTTNYTYVNEGMTRDVDDPSIRDYVFLEPPTCAFADFWKVALTQDAPADAVATISYDDEGYEFRIRDLSISLDFDTDCQLKP